MKQLRYNNAANPIRFSVPEEWDVKDLSALTLTVKDDSANVLLAATAVTMYGQTELDGAASRYDDTISLNAPATDLEIGDQILITGVSADEVRMVEGYNTTTFAAKLDQILEEDHDDTAPVYGLFGTVNLDTTDTDTFKLGQIVTLIWTPTGTGATTRELVQISSARVDILDIRERFRDLHPRAYKAFITPVESKFERMVTEAERQVRIDLKLALMDYDRIVDQEICAMLIIAKMAYLWTFDGDDDMLEERKFLGGEYDKVLTSARNLPVWGDHDQDDKKDDGEETTHQAIFERNW